MCGEHSFNIIISFLTEVEAFGLWSSWVL